MPHSQTIKFLETHPIILGENISHKEGNHYYIPQLRTRGHNNPHYHRVGIFYLGVTDMRTSLFCDQLKLRIKERSCVNVKTAWRCSS